VRNVTESPPAKNCQSIKMRAASSTPRIAFHIDVVVSSNKPLPAEDSRIGVTGGP
jgi:hypothetical protein